MPQNEDKENQNPVAQPAPVNKAVETEEQKKKRLEAEQEAEGKKKVKDRFSGRHPNIFRDLERDGGRLLVYLDEKYRKKAESEKDKNNTPGSTGAPSP